MHPLLLHIHSATGPFSEWIECFGPYVLCSVANCSIIADSGTPLVPLQAECGCLSPLRDSEDAIGKSYVTPNIIKSQSVYNATRQVCYGGEDPATGVENTCTLNSAPVCRAINSDTMYDGIWPYISTYVVYANQGAQVRDGCPCRHCTRHRTAVGVGAFLCAVAEPGQPHQHIRPALRQSWQESAPLIRHLTTLKLVL
jgi:hypothetical protein